MPVTSDVRDVVEISDDIRAVVVFDPESGAATASTLGDDVAEAVAEAGAAMLRRARLLRSDAEPVRIEVATASGRVYVLASGRRAAAAVARGDATSQLVFHDLRRCLA